MTTLSGPFPDLEKALVEALPGLLVVGGGQTITAGTDTPSNLESVLPFVRVGVIADPDDGYTRQATVDIDVFAASRADGYALAEQARGLLLSTRRLGGVTLDRVLTTTGPTRVPWDNPNIRRFTSTFRISTRR